MNFCTIRDKDKVLVNGIMITHNEAAKAFVHLLEEQLTEIYKFKLTIIRNLFNTADFLQESNNKLLISFAYSIHLLFV
jgi:SPX domain protein involved in polyphosphate accumulation